MGGGGDGGDTGGESAGSSTPATTESAAPAPAAAATPAPAEPAAPVAAAPTPPWVTAAQTRQKIPVWAIPVLAMLPLWGVVYALTLDEPTPTEPGAFELGSEVYNGQGCAGCHGGAGGGQGAVPSLVGDNNPNVVFENPADMVAWIALGTTGFQSLGLDTYGNGKPVGGNGNMPGWMDSYTAEQLMSVVLHERYTLNDDEFDPEIWAEGEFEETLESYEIPADMIEGYAAVLEEWIEDPPAP